MEKEKYEKAQMIQRKIDALNMVKTRVDNKDNTFIVKFGVSIGEYATNFAPIMYEDALNKFLTDITKKYCDEKLAEYQKEFESL